MLYCCRRLDSRSRRKSILLYSIYVYTLQYILKTFQSFEIYVSKIPKEAKVFTTYKKLYTWMEYKRIDFRRDRRRVFFSNVFYAFSLSILIESIVLIEYGGHALFFIGKQRWETSLYTYLLVQVLEYIIFCRRVIIYKCV